MYFLFQVKGLVCNLIKLKDIEYATGVQVAAGAKVKLFLFIRLLPHMLIIIEIINNSFYIF